MYVVHHNTLLDSFQIRIVWFQQKQDTDRIAKSTIRSSLIATHLSNNSPAALRPSKQVQCKWVLNLPLVNYSCKRIQEKSLFYKDSNLQDYDWETVICKTTTETSNWFIRSLKTILLNFRFEFRAKDKAWLVVSVKL